MSDDKQENSPDRQRESVGPYTQRNGWRKVREYVDEGERGWDLTRSEFLQLIEDAKKGLLDVVVIDEYSRLSRSDNVEFNATVAYPLREAGVAVAVVSKDRVHTFRGDSLADELSLFLEQHQTHQESMNNARRVSNNARTLAAKGAIHSGKAPLGYRRVYVNDAPRYVLGPEAEVETVRFIFRAYVEQDLSLADVCRRLEARGVLSPNGQTHWRPNTVRSVLVNETYTGAYVYNRRHYGRFFSLGKVESVAQDNPRKKITHKPKEEWFVIPKVHDAIVSDETFRRAAEQLTRNRRRTTPVAGRGDFLFAKLLRCGHCGCFMTGQRGGSRRAADWRAYRCTRHGTTGECRPFLVQETDVLTRVMRTLRDRFFNPDVLRRLRDMAAQADEVSASDRHVRRLREEEDALKANIAKAKRKLSLLDDDLVEEVVKDIRAWQDRLTALEADIRESKAPNNKEAIELLIREVEQILGQIETAVHDADRQAIRALLQRLVAWVKLDMEAIPLGTRKHKYRIIGGDVILRGGSLVSALAHWDGVSSLPPIRPLERGEDRLISLFSNGAGAEQAYEFGCSILVA